MYLDCDPPIAGGRELWGFPKKLASPSLKVEKDTLFGVLRFGQRCKPHSIATFVGRHFQPAALQEQHSDFHPPADGAGVAVVGRLQGTLVFPPREAEADPVAFEAGIEFQMSHGCPSRQSGLARPEHEGAP